MNASEFIAKWQQVQLSERSAAQQHFLDLCALVGHPPPAAFDPTGEKFMFERGAAKHGGGDGWADVWKKGFFGWEYKGQKKNLDTAYDQLLQYREALENPPLLVVCDMDRIVVHTNFTAVVNQVHEIPLETIGEPRSLEILRAVFSDPDKLKPGRTSEAVTKKAAEVFAGIAGSLRARGVPPDVYAHFLDRIVFALFAEDIGLLPGRLFSTIIQNAVPRPALFADMAGQLFRSMAQGGVFGAEPIRHFNGSLFEDATALELTADELRQIQSVTDLDWSAVDVSIFGTLFVRGMDPAKRAQLGAEYTSRRDIELIVEPVIMAPLRAEWAVVREAVTKRLAAAGNSKSKNKNSVLRNAKNEGYSIVGTFLQKLAHLRVLDPACGSGNFLYVTLQKLKDLEKEIILFAIANGLGAFLPTVGPWQLYGIEVNPYAYDLALMTVWIGYLQWVKANGFGFPNDPILHKLEDNFRCMDSILDLTDPQNPREPEWPRVHFIVGNPPFLGGKMLRRELGDEYMSGLFALWQGRVPHEADLCCYWFEKARQHIADGKCRRAGLLATQGIRGGANREVLKRIQETGNIFWAVSDREWILDGANVHVSMVAFDDGTEESRTLDGQPVESINQNLAATTVDMTVAKPLSGNRGTSFMGVTPAGAFDTPFAAGLQWLACPNSTGRPSSDVVRPYLNGKDLNQRSREQWTVDFGIDMAHDEAVGYELPFRHVREHVFPERVKNSRQSYRDFWWRYAESRPAMRTALSGLNRYLATCIVARHRLFVWLPTVVIPANAVIVFARDDDYFFGVLHSRLHEVWALALGTQLREKESGFRYTPTTCFETFPFPWAPGSEPVDDPRVKAIAESARDLCELRERWLNPPEWTRPEVLEVPATCGGPWDRFIVNPRRPAQWAALSVAEPPPDSTLWEFAAAERNVEAARRLDLAAKPLAPGEVGIARYPRLVPQDTECAKKLQKRTLTALYNQRPEWLQAAHRRLDDAVAAAYDWPADLADEAILAKLLALNAARASAPANP